MLAGFGLLIQFMTRIPLPINIEYQPKRIGKSFKYFPLIGVIIGAILSVLFVVLNNFIESKYVVAILLVIVDVIITGGLHLDGLADTFDAIYSYRDKEKMLEIMKDSRIGANGTIVLILYFLLKTFLLAEMDWQMILLTPIIARLCPVLNAGFGRYARKEGMGKAIVDFTDKKAVVISMLITLIFAVSIAGMNGVIIIVVSSIFALFFKNEVTKKIDGITGDTLGAVLELSTLFILLTALILK